MCFSPTASFTAAAALAAISAISYIKAPDFKWKLFALTPLFFAIQQALEGIVWLTLMKDDFSSSLHHYSVLGFVFFAAIFWPLWIPEVFYLLETNIKRRFLLAISQSFGAAFAVASIAQLYTHGVTAQIAARHIAYDVHWEQQVLTSFPAHLVYPIGMAVYLIAVVLPFFFSSVHLAWLIGIVISAGFIAAQVSYSVAFGSVWCFFGALASALALLIILMLPPSLKLRGNK